MNLTQFSFIEWWNNKIR